MHILAWIALIALLLLAAIATALVLFTLYTARRVEAAVPPIGRFVEVPGARLHVVERGSGPGLLLLHGAIGQLCHFTYGLVDRLAGEFHVVAVDRPGSGYSAWAPGHPASLAAQADALAALIEALGLGRCVVVGHSFGGAVALAMAQRHPERVAALALVAPFTHYPCQLPPELQGKGIKNRWLRAIMAWTVAIPIGLSIRGEFWKKAFSPQSVPPDFDTHGGQLLSMRPSHWIAAIVDATSIQTELPEIARGYGSMRLPVGILFGRSDPALSPREHGETLAAELPGAQLTLIEGGHMLPFTAPDRVVELIREVAERANA